MNMQKNKISATATRRFMAGALSVALLGGGLAVVPAVATAQDAQCVVNEPRKGNGVGELSFDKQTYKPGDVVTMTGTGFAARPSDGFLGMKLNSNKSEWPADQSAGDNLEYNEGNATTLEIPAATVGNGNFTVRVVLPAFDAKFQAGKQVITLLGGNDGGPVASRSAVIWVNETGDDSDACGATPKCETATRSAATTRALATGKDFRSPSAKARSAATTKAFATGNDFRGSGTEAEQDLGAGKNLRTCKNLGKTEAFTRTAKQS